MAALRATASRNGIASDAGEIARSAAAVAPAIASPSRRLRARCRVAELCDRAPSRWRRDVLAELEGPCSSRREDRRRHRRRTDWLHASTMVLSTTLKIERRAADDAQAPRSLRSGTRAICELVRARLHLLEQPRVLDGDHGLVGEGLDQFDLLVGEWPHRARVRRREHADEHPFAQQWARRATVR